MKTVPVLFLAGGVLARAALAQSEEPAPATQATPPAPEAAAETTAVKSAAPVGASDGGFWIQTADGDYRLHVRGYIQFDGRFYQGDTANLGTSGFVLRRVRPILQGTLAKYFDFQFTPDFGLGTVVIQDAYIEAHYSSKLRVRIGKYKPQFGLERLHSATNILFVERALPTDIAPNRDLGVDLRGELADGIVWYSAGVFNGVVDGGSADLDTNDGKDLVGRLILAPFKKSKGILQNLSFGIAGTTGNQSGALPTYKDTPQLTFFSYATGVVADGRHERWSPQASYYVGPLSLYGEYARSTQAIRKAADPAATNVSNDAWEITAAVLLTGEKSAPDPVTPNNVRPRRPFDPKQGQWGALELVARVTGLTVDPLVFAGGFADPTKSAQKASSWAIGLNWYLNRNIKQVVDFDHTSFTGGATSGDRQTDNAILIRTQLSF